jgi:hypothetical protein
MIDEKYLVYKREEYEAWLNQDSDGPALRRPEPLKDAVVIRTQDIFAAAGLSAYTHTLAVLIKRAGDPSLLPVLDYFRAVTQEAEDRFERGDVKAPD